MRKNSDSFAVNVTRIASGTAFGQALGIVLAPIATRLFAPEAYGVLATFLSLTGIASSVACLKYELAILLPKSEEEAAHVFMGSLVVCLAISGLTGVLVSVGREFVPSLLGIPELACYLWLVPFVVFIVGVNGSLNHWNSRLKRFGRQGLSTAIGAVSTQTVKFSLGFAGLADGRTLIAATVLGYAASVLYNVREAWRDTFSPFRANIKRHKVLENLFRYKEFPLFSTWSTILNQCAQYVPIWLLAFYFSATVVGHFSLVVSMLGMPVGLLGMAVSQVFFQRAAQAHNGEGDLSEVVENVLKRLISVGAFPFLLISIVGQEVFSVTFGQQWLESGRYSQILSLWFLFQFFSSPISMLINIFQKQRFFLCFNFVLLASRAVSLWFGGLAGSISLALALYSLAGVLCYGFLMSWLVLLSGIPVSRMIKHLLSGMLFSMLFLLPAITAKYLIELQVSYVLGVSLVSSILYFVTVVKRDQALEQSVAAVLRAFGFRSA